MEQTQDGTVVAERTTAAEKAMRDIGAVLDQFFEGEITHGTALNAIARANGAYSVDRIGEGA